MKTFNQIAIVHAAELDRLRATNAELLAALKRLNLACAFDVLNPCWDNRPDDVAGKHWGVGNACPQCSARAAIAKATQS